MSEDDQYIVGPSELIIAALDKYRKLNLRVQSLEICSPYKLLEELRSGFQAGEEFLKRAEGIDSQKSLIGRLVGRDNEGLYEALLARDVDDREGVGGVFRQSLQALEHKDVEVVASSYGKFADEEELEKHQETFYDLETVLTTVQLLQIRTQNLEPDLTLSDAIEADDYFNKRHIERRSFYADKVVGFSGYLRGIHKDLRHINNEVGIALLNVARSDKDLLGELAKTLASPLGQAITYFDEAVSALDSVKGLRDEKQGTRRIEKKRLEIKPIIATFHPENSDVVRVVYENTNRLRRKNLAAGVKYLADCLVKGVTPSQRDMEKIASINGLLSILNTFERWGIVKK